MPRFVRDYETRSAVNLKLSGVHAYAEDESTDVWCMSYCVDDGPVKIWKKGEPCPPEYVAAATEDGWTTSAFNAAFERAIESHIMVTRYGWPIIPVTRDRCTMAMAYAMALPASLENCAAALGLDIRKDMAGRALMLKMAAPRKWLLPGDDGYLLARAQAARAQAADDPNTATVLSDGVVLTWWGLPEYREKLYAYCIQDTEVERGLSKRLMPLSPFEQDLWALDQAINDRGIRVDIPAIRNALAVVAVEKARLDGLMSRVTGGAVSACSQVAKLLEWAATQGVDLTASAKADVIDALERKDLPLAVRDALELRQEAARSSTAKLKAMLNGASRDGRVRGTMQYHGANTGRWSGRRIQPHNFPRPSLLDPIGIVELLDFLHDA